MHDGLDLGALRHEGDRPRRRRGAFLRRPARLRLRRDHRPQIRHLHPLRPLVRHERPGGAADPEERHHRLRGLHRQGHRPPPPLRGARESRPGQPAALPGPAPLHPDEGCPALPPSSTADSRSSSRSAATASPSTRRSWPTSSAAGPRTVSSRSVRLRHHPADPVRQETVSPDRRGGVPAGARRAGPGKRPPSRRRIRHPDRDGRRPRVAPAAVDAPADVVFANPPYRRVGSGRLTRTRKGRGPARAEPRPGRPFHRRPPLPDARRTLRPHPPVERRADVATEAARAGFHPGRSRQVLSFPDSRQPRMFLHSWHRAPADAAVAPPWSFMKSRDYTARSFAV